MAAWNTVTQASVGQANLVLILLGGAGDLLSSEHSCLKEPRRQSSSQPRRHVSQRSFPLRVPPRRAGDCKDGASGPQPGASGC